MQDNNETEEIKQLKREISKLRLEGNLRKSLSNQLTIQKKIADDAKMESLRGMELRTHLVRADNGWLTIAIR